MVLSTSSRRGALLPTLLVTAAVLILAAPARHLAATLWGDLTGHSTTILGEGDERVMVASSVKSIVQRCTPDEIVGERRATS